MKTNQQKIEHVRGTKKDVLFAAVICAAAIVCAAPSLNGEFLNWDDDRFVVNNPNVSSLTASNVVDAFSGLRFESYQPLHLLSYMIDGSLGQGRAWVYRLHNLALYLAGLVLFFAWLRRLGLSSGAALGGGLFFALAPYHAESVVWIAGRKDVLMLVFVFIAWHLHLRADLEAPHRKKLRVLCALFFVLALLSKSSAMVFPWAAVVVDAGLRKKPLGRSFLTLLPQLLLSIGAAIALFFIWSDASLLQQEAPAVQNRAALAGWTFAHYLKTAVLPFFLSPIYAAPSVEEVQNGAVFTAIFAAAAMVLAIFCLRRKKPAGRWVAVAGVFAVSLAPFLNIAPLYYLRADRYLLLPSVGLALGAALIFQGAAEKKALSRRFWAALLSVFILVMGAASALESYYWHDSLRLWRHAVKEEPDAFFARLKLGETLRNADEPEASVRQYRAALSIRPLSPTALGGVFWGALLQDMRDTDTQDKASAQKLAFSFVSVADNAPKLRALIRYLEQRRWTRAAAVAKERFTPPRRR